MLDERQARERVILSPLNGLNVRIGMATELREGWYFPLRWTQPMAGCNGVIVNKQTGKLFALGSAFPVERDLKLYDLGYQFKRYDLTITKVYDRNWTLATLVKLRLQYDVPELESGGERTIPRDVTHAMHAKNLDALPVTYSNVSLYFVAEKLEDARASKWFTFALTEYSE